MDDLSENSPDNINHPSHYTSHPSGVECIEIARHMDFLLGNALKYIWRADLKDDALEDLRKARRYLEWAIEKREDERAQKEFTERLDSELAHFDKSLLSHYLEETNALVQEAARYTKTPEFGGPTSSEAFTQVGDLKVVDGLDGPVPGQWNLFEETDGLPEFGKIRWQVAPDESVWHDNGKSWGDGLAGFVGKNYCTFLGSSEEPFWKVKHPEFPGFLDSFQGEEMLEYAKDRLARGYFVTFQYLTSDLLWEFSPDTDQVLWGPRDEDHVEVSSMKSLDDLPVGCNRLVHVGSSGLLEGRPIED